ncbi:hypothetical protein PHLCEN_2v6847 [Hermanssonia centrifuga]|uniref:FAD-binding PCMH-type domain-containing protein n=1 Tax=Hermanssonia centrifuga TaxID=98765 RepID=A0A2R6NYA5_9APHY|nr:hypothetical protein PHLCEN_2v6847 [Hermanssonia centrifuga]
MADFEAFRKQFQGDLVTPSDPGYDEAIQRWARNTSRPAKVVAFVKNCDDIASALAYARAEGLRIAVRGGGHNAAGASSCEGGLVIDLSKYLNHVHVDPKEKVIHVEGGAVWETVDKAAIQHRLATVGGTVNHATVVTADGTSHVASATENEDLFYGIRGGGSNFGIVTVFTLKLYDQQPTVFAGPIVFTPDKCEQVASVLASWWEGAGEKEGLLAGMSPAPDGSPCITLFLFFNGTEAMGRVTFKPFFDLEPVVDMSKEIPFEELNSMLNANAVPGRNYYMKGALLSKSPLEDLSLSILTRVVQASSSGELTTFVGLEYFPHGKINSVPADATPYRRDLTGGVAIIVSWDDDTPEKSKRAAKEAREIASLIGPEGEGYGNYGDGSYGPDSDASSMEGAVPPSKAKALFGSSYARMQAIKKKYDPDMVFNKWFVIEPAN